MLTGGFGGAAVSGGYSAGGGGSAWDTAKSALVGGLMGAIGGATMMGTFTYGSGKLITSNMFVDWLARGVELKPGALGSHLVALAERAAMQNDPYLEQAVGEYLTNVMSILGSQEEKNKAGVINIPKGAMAPPPQTNVINPGALLNQRRE